MRDPRLTRLVIAAHGSADPRFAATVDALADRLRALRDGLDVAVGYLEHGPPDLRDVCGDGDVVVPLLLSRGYHALVDIPAQVPGARVADAVGPDARLVDALVDRLAEAGYDGTSAVVLAAAGSSDPGALDDVRLAAAQLADRLGVDVTAAFVSAGSPRLEDLDEPTVVASYLVAPGAFHDAMLRCGAAVVSAPIGDHPALAETLLARYDETCQNVRRL
ncbi:MAG: sirohydrochlorin chelatase [Frankiales bacterium]|nr:sirohydrochlorin chelatase [Frankiales bacterium]